MSLLFTVTNAGRAALVNAANTGTDAVTVASVGVTATAVVPSKTATTLPGEFKRITTLAGDVVAPDTIHLVAEDNSADAYTVRSIALYLNDGTLFGLYGQNDPLLSKTAQSLMLLAIDIRFADIDATSITFGDASFLNPPATTDRQGVVEFATTAESQAGVDDQRAITPKTAKLSVVNWIGYTPANRAGDTFAGAIRRDAQYYLDLQTGNPLINWDANDFEQFDRITNQWNRYIGGSIRMSLNGTTLAMTGDISASGGGYFTTGVRFGDTNFYASFSGGNPVINLDAGTTYLAYLRTAKRLSLVIDNAERLAVTAAGITRSGNTVWDAGNDGPGSGSDADLLDGQEGSWYANIVARLGYTPANRAGDTFGGAIRRDAQYYLDLQSGNPLVNWDANDFEQFDRTTNQWNRYIGGVLRLTLNATTLTMNGDLSISGGGYFTGGVRFGETNFYAGFSGGNPVINLDAGTNYLAYLRTAKRLSLVIDNAERLAVTAAGITRSGSTVWDAGNDGAGSGLDADLLDGFQASAFDRVVEADYSQNWKRVYADGWIEQGGLLNVSLVNEVAFDLVFHKQFPNACRGVSAMPVNSSSSSAGDVTIQEVALYTNKATLFAQNEGSNTPSQNAIRWRAWGF